MTAPCAWTIDPAAIGVCPDWAEYTAEIQTAALSMATTYLWAATGRQYGPCPVIVRPAQDRLESTAYRAYPVWPGSDPVVAPMPFLLGGTWRNCGCGARCCCRPECAVVLRGPVAAVNEVLVDGVIIPSEAYRVDVTQGTYLLVRLDGVCWPTCQDFQADDDAVGAFVVDYDLGKALPSALELAAAILVCEYGKSLTGAACRLPARMTSLTRQGVTVEVEPASPEDGMTGITEVDAIVAALNPSKRRSPPLFLSPDLPERCDRITVVGPGAS